MDKIRFVMMDEDGFHTFWEPVENLFLALGRLKSQGYLLMEIDPQAAALADLKRRQPPKGEL